jgi:hypothetical protein
LIISSSWLVLLNLEPNEKWFQNSHGFDANWYYFDSHTTSFRASNRILYLVIRKDVTFVEEYSPAHHCSRGDMLVSPKVWFWNVGKMPKVLKM